MDSKVYLAIEQYGIPDVDDEFVQFVFRVVLGELKQPAKEVGLMIVTDEHIQKLNREYRGKDKPTNVLSFVQEDFPEDMGITGMEDYIGDVYISQPTVQKEALEDNVSEKQKFTHLFIHGILHLLGYDHETDDEAEKMEALEEKIMGYIE